MNRLLFGDNLPWLRNREIFPDASVDLVYLDPPFNSNADYNVLFREASGEASPAQFHAFTDTWNWADAAETYNQFLDDCPNLAVVDMMQSFFSFLRSSPMMAYLAMMAPRLVELHRILKPTGSLYLHCDPTASHYLKLMLDGVFGAENFRTEIIWKRNSAHSDARQGRKQHGRIHDIILFYTKGGDWTWNNVFTEYDQDYVDGFYKHVEPKTGRRYRLGDITAPGGASPKKKNPCYEFLGVTRYWRYSKKRMRQLYDEGRIIQTKPGTVPAYKRYLDEMEGVPLQDLWTDVKPIGAQAAERLGYPTQKPQSLLERIIASSTNPGDMVLDPFCGCGTTIQVAQKLNRRWIGIDITHLAIGLIKTRLDDAYGPEVRQTYEVIGEPTDVAGAAQLAEENKYQFQYWALGLCGARPTEGIKKGADRGIDGRLYFHDDNSGSSRQIVFSVKGGHNIGVSEVRDLIGVLQRERAEIGVYISFEEPTKPMLREAAEAGFYTSPGSSGSAGGKYPRIQLLTIRDLLEGTKSVQRPLLHARDTTFRRAPRSRPSPATNLTLNLTDHPGD